MGGETLTIADLNLLMDIMRGVQTGAYLDWYPQGSDDAQNKVITVMRNLVTQTGAMYPFNADVRDAYVLVTDPVASRYIPMGDVMRALDNAMNGNYGTDQPMAAIRNK